MAASGSSRAASSSISNFTASSLVSSLTMGYGKSPLMSRQYDLMSYINVYNLIIHAKYYIIICLLAAIGK
jgi:hypothetical protein